MWKRPSSILTLLALLGFFWGGVAVAEKAVPVDADPREVHLGELRQLTFGGENAEAYWSPDGQELIYQAKVPPYECDQIFRISAAGGEPRLVSTGKGRTTCAYFSYPDGERILYSSTHAADAACPAPPDRSQGYVWPIYSSFALYSAATDGSNLKVLAESEGYDAEATVCQQDGSVIFTSTRDGDLDLYRMDADGSNLLRLTDTPGYDGGAFFSQDCSKIVWRASRPTGKALEDYQRLLSQGMVRPSKLEIWVANADGTNARQVTYLDAASFAPYFFPGGERILFSTNYGDPRGREFDLWAVNVDGTDLERITYTPEFDGFPMFSPDGEWLAFASNRNNQERGETNLFVARWRDGHGEKAELSAADRFRDDATWLAADGREGRGVGTKGLDAAAEWLAERYAEIGLEPGGADGSYLQRFEVVSRVRVAEGTGLAIDGEAVDSGALRPTWFSASGSASAEVVPAGYGISDEDAGIDDYAGLDVEGKLVAVRRFVPESVEEDEDLERRLSALRYKAFTARQKGAVGLIVVDLPEGDEPPEEAPLPSLRRESGGDAGIPVVVATRAAAARLFDGGRQATLTVQLEQEKEPADNVVGILRAPEGQRQEGAILVGAHYDHLGFGGHGSLAPDDTSIHNGADDNASGTAALLEAARQVAARSEELQRDVWFVAFSGEEMGLLGSTHLTRNPPEGLEIEGMAAMINMDMVGRLRRNRLSVLGTDSAEEWESIVAPACAEIRLQCQLGGDGYGASDQTPFYAAGIPVLHLFTGIHDDYHKPSDDSELLNAAGGARTATLAANLTLEVSQRGEPLTYKTSPAPPPRGDSRSRGASLGTIPDYAGNEDESASGVLLAGVRPGSAADKAGMQRGDVLVELGGVAVGDIHDFVYVLRSAKPGDKATAVVERDGQRLELVITYDASRGIR